MPFTIVDQGSFTSDGTVQDISLPSSADYFVVKNLTQLATTQATGRGVMFEWYKDLVSDDNAIEWLKTNSTNALNMTLVTSGGFTYYETRPSPEAAIAVTAITAADPAVVSASQSYSDGDRVVLYNNTAMLQIGGMEFSISSTSGSAFSLVGLDASGFAAAATGGFVRRVARVGEVLPEYNYVTSISQASSAVVEVSILNSFVVGQLVTFSVPSDFGMVEMDQLTGKVTALDEGATNHSITVDIDSSAFTAFAFPASGSFPGASCFPTVAPAGSRNIYDTTNVPFRTGQFYPYMRLAAGAQSPAGSSNDVIVWQAYKMER